MKRKNLKRDLDQSFFNAMNYELAGEIGILNNEEMLQNKKLLTAKKNNKKNQ